MILIFPIYEPIGALAHLQLGRAYTLSGDNAKARAAYEKFLALWKEADPDIPILKQAKSEYATLQEPERVLSRPLLLGFPVVGIEAHF